MACGVGPGWCHACDVLRLMGSGARARLHCCTERLGVRVPSVHQVAPTAGTAVKPRHARPTCPVPTCDCRHSIGVPAVVHRRHHAVLGAPPVPARGGQRARRSVVGANLERLRDLPYGRQLRRPAGARQVVGPGLGGGLEVGGLGGAGRVGGEEVGYGVCGMDTCGAYRGGGKWERAIRRYRRCSSRPRRCMSGEPVE